MNITEKLTIIVENMQRIYEAGKQAGGGSAALDYTVTFIVDGEPYELVSVKDGNAIDIPATEPTSENGTFNGWMNGEEKVEFPFAPSEDVELNALFIYSVLPLLYEHFEFDPIEYPFVGIQYSTQYNGYRIHFAKESSQNTSGIKLTSKVYIDALFRTLDIKDIYDTAEIVTKLIAATSRSNLSSTTSAALGTIEGDYVYCNVAYDTTSTFVQLV